MHGAGVDNPLVEYSRQSDGTYVRSWFAADYKGSIVATTNDAGTTTAIYSYGDYGEPNTQGGAAFRYTGQRLDPDSGLYYYKARWYSPNLGRFLSTDPIGMTDQINLYAYVMNDPVNASDPYGLFTCLGGKSDCAAVDSYFATAQSAYSALDPSSGDAAAISAAMAYLRRDDVTITPTSLPEGISGDAPFEGGIQIDVGHINTQGGNGWSIAVNPGMSATSISNAIGAGTLVHEAWHQINGYPSSRATEYTNELTAYHAEQGVYEGLGVTTDVYSPSWSQSINDDAAAAAAQGSTQSFCDAPGAPC